MGVLIDSLSHLETNPRSCARLSVWHTRAYIVGVQKAARVLGLNEEDGRCLEAFDAHVKSKFGTSGTLYQRLWSHASCPSESVDLFLAEWTMFLKSQVVNRDRRPIRPLPAVLDLTAELASMGAKPRFYFCAVDVSHLRAWFDGVDFVSAYVGGIETRPDMLKFVEWLRSPETPDSNCPWEMLLVSQRGGDSEDAYSRFFDMMRAFNERKITLT